MSTQVQLTSVFVQELFGPFVCEKQGTIRGEGS